MLPRIASARRLLSMHAAAGERMRAVQVTAKLGRLDDSCKGCFAIVDLPRPPPPAAGHVVVRVARAQINPSDTSFFKGVYGQRLQLPSMAGFEGCGVVVDSADETVPQGARVAFRALGSWAEFCTAPAALCIPLDTDTGWSNAAGALVNPLTAYSMIRMAMQRGDKAIVATAAASGLGRQLTRYASACGIDVVAVVRRAEQMQACREEGAVVTLDASADSFDADMKDACEAHGCTLALDAVAGAQAGAILNAMAPGGKLVVYGGLSGRPVDGVAWNELIFQRKSMEGFWMTHRVQTQLATPEGASELRRDLTAVGRLLSTHLRTNVSRTFDLAEVGDALVFMRQNMSAGKVQLTVSEAQLESR